MSTRDEGHLSDDGESQPRARAFLVRLPFVKERVDPIAIVLILLCSGSIVGFAMKLHIFQFWTEFLRSTTFLRISTYPLLVSALILFTGLVFRTILWFHYKPDTAKPDERLDWPLVTVIMAALNEEELISESIDSIFSGNYPADRLEVVCINDGSTDGTLDRMLKARDRYGDRLKVISFKRNLGKRKAFYCGVKAARGNIIVSADTDSKVGRSAIRNVVLPLLRDEQVGAVAGRVAVLNERDNFLTRMLSTRYAISFDFGRGYQSVYGTVFCCPGALTAYRKEVVRKVIGDWLHQMFLNVPCHHGEDRALTTLVLKCGYFVKYQSNAVVYTKVPTKLGQLNRMYLRWTRSYLRESVFFARFMFLPYRKGNRVLPVFDFLFENLLHPFHIFTLSIVMYSFVISPLFLVRHLAFLVLSSFVLSLYYLRTQKSMTFLYGIPYALITTFLQWWLVPYSALTIRNQSWLTR